MPQELYKHTAEFWNKGTQQDMIYWPEPLQWAQSEPLNSDDEPPRANRKSVSNQSCGRYWVTDVRFLPWKDSNYKETTWWKVAKCVPNWNSWGLCGTVSGPAQENTRSARILLKVQNWYVLTWLLEKHITISMLPVGLSETTHETGMTNTMRKLSKTLKRPLKSKQVPTRLTTRYSVQYSHNC